MDFSKFWKKENDKAYEQFLQNPKEVFEKTQEAMTERDLKIEELTAEVNSVKAKHIQEISDVRIQRDERCSEYKIKISELESQVNTLTSSKDMYKSMVNDAEASATQKKSELMAEYEELKLGLETRLERDLKAAVALKEAELEKDYYHEVHEFLEEQREKERDLVGEVVRNSILAFHNETANAS